MKTPTDTECAYQILTEAGYEISRDRLPYTYHHDVVREQQFCFVGRSDVAATLDQAYRSESEENLRMALLTGCIISLMRSQPDRFLRALDHPKANQLFLKAAAFDWDADVKKLLN